MSEQTVLKGGEASGTGVDAEVEATVREILSAVRERGDDAVIEFTRRFDDVEREDLRVSSAEIERAKASLDRDERQAIDYTIENVSAFHREQLAHLEGFEREFKPGITLGQRIVPIEAAGVYVPGGRHPLVATPAMTIVPAAVAGVDRIVACAPPQPDGTVTAAQLYAMDRAGADEIYCVGGAQAIGAMAYGTASIPAVDLVTGPGNVFTTEAKRQVFGHVGVDFLAGPTEVLIIADDSADPAVVAADLLAQAEHDPHSKAVLVTLDESLGHATIEEIERQLPELETEETARSCWTTNGEVILVDGREAAVEIANEYAMEHVQVMTADPQQDVDGLRHYGSLFLGHHAPVVFGDKVVGTNHCLPTGRAARFTGGIWVGTYVKTPTHQEVTAAGAAALAPWAETICRIEGTDAHRRSAAIRRPGAAEIGGEAR